MSAERKNQAEKKIFVLEIVAYTTRLVKLDPNQKGCFSNDSFAVNGTYKLNGLEPFSVLLIRDDEKLICVTKPEVDPFAACNADPVFFLMQSNMSRYMNECQLRGE